MKKIIAISAISFLLIYSSNVIAQTENFLDTFIMETDSFIRFFNDSPKILEIKKFRFSIKTKTNVMHEGENFTFEQRIKYKKGYKIERSKIKYARFDKTKSLLDVVLINDEYIYIKRTKYIKGNWDLKQSVEFLVNGNAYRRMNYYPESEIFDLCTFRR